MEQHDLARRTVLRAGAAVGVAGLASVTVAGPAAAFGGPRGVDEVLPWLDQPDPIPPALGDAVTHPLIWEDLDSWRTPNAEFFTVRHYDQPVLTAGTWRLEVDGLVEHPVSLSLATLKSRSRREVDFTLECSGNHGLPFAIGAIGNARWAGTSLADVLRRARPRPEGTEVVFWGADEGTVTIRDDSGVTGAGFTGTTTPDGTGGLDLTITEQFARSMTLVDAMSPDNLLCYEMNGVALPPVHGYPLRLIAPGWYGVANVKWLNRIEVRDGRHSGRFMARDYVTVREETDGGRTVWTFTTVSHARLKSAPAKVTRRGNRHVVHGAAWGAPISRVEVQIDGGSWRRAQLHRQRPLGGQGFSWAFWTWDWGTPAAGEHSVRSRAFDRQGHLQPGPDDPYLASRRTYWENNGQVTRRVLIP